MIISIGCDLINIDSISKSIKKTERFKQRVYRTSEQEYCDIKANPFEHYAGFFTIKEAIMKALGRGWIQGVSWCDIEVGHSSFGVPYVSLYNNAYLISLELGIKKIHVSLSHTKSYAMSVVITED